MFSFSIGYRKQRINSVLMGSFAFGISCQCQLKAIIIQQKKNRFLPTRAVYSVTKGYSIAFDFKYLHSEFTITNR